MRGFGSDNHSGVHPKILAAVAQANEGHAPSYGTDDITQECLKSFRRLFGEKSQCYFAFNGTAANVLCLRAAVKPYESYFTSDQSHLHFDECGAPEFFSHAKTLLLPTHDGKILRQDLDSALIRRGDQHYAQPRLISITQPTELGTTYSFEEIRSIVQWAHKNQLYVHIDGARLANACAHLNCEFRDLTEALGVDLVSFGGTKNGLMFGEAVVLLNPQLQKDFVYIRKQSAQLPSKSRFIAAQFLAYLENNLWLDIAKHSCQMARTLETHLGAIDRIQIMHPVQSNAVFVQIPQKWISDLRKKFFFYVWDERTFVCRLMTSWDTQDSDLIEFSKLLRQKAEEERTLS